MAEQPQKLVSDFSKKLHRNSWALVPGTGIAIKEGTKVFIPPGEVHLDRLESEDIFTFNSELDKAGNPELDPDATNPALNISAYTNLFLKVFQDFDCGCIIYAQPHSAVLVSELNKKFFKIKNNQMITMISNGETKEQYPWTHELSVPIISNPNEQGQLFDKLEKAFEDNPETNAVLIKGNGIFVCGETWSETVTMFEAYLYLFNLSLQLKQYTGNVSEIKVAVTDGKKLVNNTFKSPSKPETVKFNKKENGHTNTYKPPTKPVARKVNSSTTRPYMLDSVNNKLALRKKRMALERLRTGPQSGGYEGKRLRTNLGGYDGGVGQRRSAASFMIGGDNSMNDNNMNMMQQQQQQQQQLQQQQQMRQQQQMMEQQMMNQQMMQQQQMMNQQMMPIMNAPVQNRESDITSRLGGSAGPDRSNRLFRNLTRPSTSPRSSRGGRGTGRGGSVKNRLGFKSNISVDPVALKKDLTVSMEDY